MLSLGGTSGAYGFADYASRKSFVSPLWNMFANGQSLNQDPSRVPFQTIFLTSSQARILPVQLKSYFDSAGSDFRISNASKQSSCNAEFASTSKKKSMREPYETQRRRGKKGHTKKDAAA